MRKCTISFLFIFFATVSLHAELFINEFMAINVLAWANPDGDYEDWIEIHNSGDAPVDLAGYYLTDDVADPDPFRIQSGHSSKTTIPAKGFLILFASGSPERSALDLGFKLSQSGEMIVLLRPDGMTVEDSLTFGPQTRDISYGRSPDGGSNWVYFGESTPDASNGFGFSEITQTPKILQSPGFYPGNIAVTALPANPGDVIRYTLDGADPVESSSIYSGSVPVVQTAVFKARAFRNDALSSTPMACPLFIDTHHALPVFSLMTDPDNLYDPETGIYVVDHDGRAWERSCEAAFFPNRTFGFQIPAGARIQGNSGPKDYQKKSFRLYFRSGYGADRLVYSLFPRDFVQSFKTLVLRAGYDDSMEPTSDGTTDSSTLLRDPLVTELWRRTGYLTPQDRFAILYLNTEFHGIYDLKESIDEDFVKDHLGFADLDLVRTRWDTTELVYGRHETWNDLIHFFENNTFTDDAMLSQANQRMDLDNFTTLLALVHATQYTSWAYGTFMFRERKPEARWQWTIWDADRSYRSMNWNFLTADLNPTADYLNNLIIQKLLQNQQFRNNYINRIADLFNTIFSPDDVTAVIDSLAGVIASDIPDEVDRWSNTVSRWNENVAMMKENARSRPDIVRQQMLDYFQLGGKAQLFLMIGQGKGRIRINTVTLDDFPWTGTYFQGVPVTLTAIPDPGFRFAGWSDTSLGANATISLTDDRSVTALFQPLNDSNCELITPSQMPIGQRLPIVARIRDKQWRFNPCENNPLQVRFGGVRSDTTLPIKRGAGVMTLTIPSDSDISLSLESATVPKTQKSIQVTAKPVETYTGTLSTGDVVWDASAERLISGILTIPAGCRLIIRPGTWVIFEDRAGMTVRGEIQSQGTEHDPIVFTSSDWSKPWGGIEMNGAQSFFNYCFFLNAGGDFSKGWAHTGRQPILFAREQSQLQIENGYFLFSPGKAVCAEDSRVRMTQSVTAFVYHGGELSRTPLFFQDNYVMNIPDDDNSTYSEDIDTDGYHINFVDPLHPEYSVIDRCFFITGKDDAIDQMGARLKITNCWLEDWIHEGVAASASDTVRIFNTVSLHNDQGFEAGYTDEGVTRGPFVFIDHCVAAYNNTGLRIGDSYSGTYHGFMRVTNSIIYGNTDNIRNYLNSTHAPLEGALDISYSMTNDPDYDASPHCITGTPVFDDFYYLQSGSLGSGEGQSASDMGRADSTVIRTSILVINEIMYNAPQDKDSQDWIELYNPGNRPQDLSSWRIKDDHEVHVFELPAGTVIPADGYLVICQDTTLFKAVYSNRISFFGNVPFGFGRGDEVRLYTPSGVTVDSVAYSNTAPWPEEADGQGYSLELQNIWQDNAEAGNWVKSTHYGGSPGYKNKGSVTDTMQQPVHPIQFSLTQNYPNPFNPVTQVMYTLPKPGRVRVTVYDLLGRHVLTAVEDARQDAGTYRIEIDGHDLASGVYFYRIKVHYPDGSQDVRTRKMVVMK